jgi:Prokaryotic glutathione synthetase, ATP-grasp domain
MTDRMTFRTFLTTFKLAAIKRPEAGEAVLPLARERGLLFIVTDGHLTEINVTSPTGIRASPGSAARMSRRRSGM